MTGEVERVRTIRYAWRRRRASARLGGIGAATAGIMLILAVLPFWIWPVGIGLWLLWSGLGPVVIGVLLIWVGWKILIT